MENIDELFLVILKSNYIYSYMKIEGYTKS